MTANELADKLDMVRIGLTLEAATMLRQQQTELDAFKLNYYNTGYSLQLRDKDETIKQQQAEIEALKAKMSLNSYDEGKNVVNQLFKVKIFRDIDGLKIWGNENGFRFHRDPDDKTKYKVYFTDDDVDKLETFVRQQQAENEALKMMLANRNDVLDRLDLKYEKSSGVYDLAKTLTDEEIKEVWYALEMDSNLFDFARAILKKASDK